MSEIAHGVKCTHAELPTKELHQAMLNSQLVKTKQIQCISIF